MEQQQKMYIINETVKNAILAYLQERPFKEVAMGVQALNNLQEVPNAPTKVKPPVEVIKK